MTKVKNPRKDELAKSLIKQGYSCKDIQGKLKRIFNSGISSNRLIEFRKEYKIASKSSKSNEVKSKNSISHDNSAINNFDIENNLLINKLWMEMQEFKQQLFDEFSQKFNHLQKIQNIVENPRNFQSESEILIYIENKKAQVYSVLSENPTNLETLSRHTGIDLDLLTIIIHELLYYKTIQIETTDRGDNIYAII
jgi:hypothetical protein